MLHVTNGVSVSLDRSGLSGEILAWVDALHEGPVPAGLGLNDLSRLRAKFLDYVWPGARSAAEILSNRDRALGRFAEHEEVTLWFEHDLYDQLQLIQILDWFCHTGIPACVARAFLPVSGVSTFPGPPVAGVRGVGQAVSPAGIGNPACATPRLSLISIDKHLGELTGPQLAGLWPRRHTVSDAELRLAAAAWRAFRAPDPVGIEELLRSDTSALPFLSGALLRHLQQFPSVENGLSRSERQILELVEAGTRDLASLVTADRAREERIFMGDTTFARYVSGLAECRHPLLASAGGGYDLTRTGREVLACRADHIRLNGINRWLGGVHLVGAEALWRWDERRQRLVAH